MNHSNLAIVIPAYKIYFLKETIESIVNQTCKRFTLYVGNDNSPYELYSVIREYENTIRIIYKKFNNNLGNHDLASHWNRCIDMVDNEEWVWLFSDDDLMDLKCVELFYKHIENHPDDELLHFNVEIINDKGLQQEMVKSFPEKLSSTEFFTQRITSDLISFAVEYIFKKKIYAIEGKFQSFDLAWGSDDATWIKIAKNKGIKTIVGAKVKWRRSQLNISSIKEDKIIIIRKLNATISYINWVKDYFEETSMKDNTTSFEKIVWIIQLLIDTSTFSFTEKMKYVLQTLNKMEYFNLRFITVAYLLYGEIKKRIKNVFSIFNFNKTEY
jgi:glycosyltransferase involved in cell wall biosynthesis